MSYEVGRILPYIAPAPLWRDDGPRWYSIITGPQAELPASAWLARNGVLEAWYPTREHRSVNKRRPNRIMTRSVPEWPRYLFALCPGSPTSWDALFDRSLRKLRSVVMVNGNPAILDEARLLEMKDVPNCLRAIRQAHAEASRIRPGDMAEIVGTEMNGWQVRIDSVDKGFASFIVPLLGNAPAKIEIGRLKKCG